METISTFEIILLLTIAAICYDLYFIYILNPPHYKKGLILSSGNSPYPGREEFPSNYKMEYKSEKVVYKFVNPTTLVFRYNFDFGKFKNLITLIGVGELKGGDIILKTRFGLITPVSLLILLFANILLLGRTPNMQEIVTTFFALLLMIAYFIFCKKAAWELPKIVAEKIDESIMH